MNKSTFLFLAVITVGLIGTGCGSSSSAPSTAEEKKSFEGGPMPKDFMSKNAGAQEAAQKAAAAAAAANAPK